MSLHRTFMRASLLGLLLGSAGALSFGPAPRQGGLPGGYVTLIYTLSGEGQAQLRGQAPEGWTVVSSERTVSLHGEQKVAMTVRLPAHVRAGSGGVVKLSVTSVGGETQTQLGEIEVLAQAGVRLTAPTRVMGDVGKTVRFAVTVTNTGNAPDTLNLSAHGTRLLVVFEPAKLQLTAGQQKTVTVSVIGDPLSPSEEVLTWLDLQSSADPQITQSARVRLQLRPGGALQIGEVHGPRLVFSVRASAQDTLNVQAGQVSNTWQYALVPGISGQLSDRVGVDVQTGGLQGSPASPFAVEPQLTASLIGDDWTVRFGYAARQLSLGGSAQWRGWLLDASGAAQTDASRVAAQLSAESQQGGRNLKFGFSVSGADARPGWTWAGRVSGHLRFALLGGEFSVASAAAAQTASGVAVPATWQADAQQSFRWRNQKYDLTQTASVARGVQSLGLIGGTRSLTPFGVRASAQLLLIGGQPRWSGSAALFGKLGAAGGFSVAGRINLADQLSWSLSPSASWTGRLGNVTSTLSGSYLYDQGSENPAWTVQTLSAGLNLDAARWNAGLEAQLKQASGKDAPPGTQLKLRLISTYAVSATSVLQGSYDYARGQDLTRPNADSQAFGLKYALALAAPWQAELSYEHLFGSANTPLDRLGVSLSGNDVLTRGLQLGLGYHLTAPGGWRQGTLQHSLSVKVSTGLDLVVATPSAVVKAFGGRDTSEVSGQAYLDRDLNGGLSTGDTPLAGLKLKVGTQVVTSDAQGKFSLRLPAGQYEAEPIGGLNASTRLESPGTAHFNVQLGKPTVLSLPFTEGQPLEVSLFDDVNHNGQRDPDENGIAYGGVLIEGPVKLHLRANGLGDVGGVALPSGTYQLRADPQQLPSGMQAGEVQTRQITLGQLAAPVSVAASTPAREVQLTYSQSDLSLLLRSVAQQRPAGADLELGAVATGAQSVSADLTDLKGQPLARLQLSPLPESEFHGWLRLSADLSGLVQLRVRAQRGQETVEQTLLLAITDGPLLDAAAVVAQVGRPTVAEVKTLRWGKALEVRWPDGQTTALSAPDGISWSGTWQPSRAVKGNAKVLLDGQDIGELDVQVEGKP